MIRLGSQSSSRALLLRQANINFIQSVSDFDEDSITSDDPRDFAYKASLGKYKELYKRYGVSQLPLLVADSVVSVNNLLLRKPKDINEARHMLNLQSGKETTIITVMIYQNQTIKFIDTSSTTYQFNVFNQADLQNYLDSGNCMGKAGAIMVEGFCKPYIKSVKGYESTARGLCVEKLLMFLKCF